jgi:hypothetical protein
MELTAAGLVRYVRFLLTSHDDMVWGLLTNHTPAKVDNDATTKLHVSILMAGRFAEAL